MCRGGVIAASGDKDWEIKGASSEKKLQGIRRIRAVMGLDGGGKKQSCESPRSVVLL